MLRASSHGSATERKMKIEIQVVPSKLDWRNKRVIVRIDGNIKLVSSAFATADEAAVYGAEYVKWYIEGSID